MITRDGSTNDKRDIWAQLAAPLPENVKEWRQDGRPVGRDGKFFARFVVYIEANTVRERLDNVVPGEWDLTLELLPALVTTDGEEANACSFKARLQVLGVIREDVGYGKDYKQAATDAFKRVAVRFGIGHELYSYEQNWVQVDGDGKYAKPVEDPGEAYARRAARNGAHNGSGVKSANAVEPSRGQRTESVGGSDTDRDEVSPATARSGVAPLATDEPSCPKCGGKLWDNRTTKRNPKAPDGKCRSRSCDGVLWKWDDAVANVRQASNGRDDEPPMPDDYDPERGF